jgi:dTMP kinase
MITGGTSKSPTNNKRGAFILLEGVDRCGKTTQCSLLLKHLLSISVAAVAMRFPDRTTSVGQLINGYLTSGQDLDDRAVHLLFSANRWEAAPNLAQELADGNTVVCDRYAYSGVAFSSAKTKEDSQGSSTVSGSGGEDLSIEWCKAPDMGLPAPDTVIFLDLSQDESEKRGGYGGERYEQRFGELQAKDEEEKIVPWHIVNAAQSIDEVQADINRIVEDTIKRVQSGGEGGQQKPLSKMFQVGEYILPSPSAVEKN